MNKLTIKIYCILWLCTSFHLLCAQIELNGVPIVNDVGCQHSELGSINVRIKPTHPPYTFKWNNGEITEKISGLEAGIYTVQIKDANGADTTLQFTIQERSCELGPQIFFTPNGDGINDHWAIAYSEFYPDARVLVYNRLGQLVYENTGEYNLTNHWDGTDLLGIPVPVATYFFVVYPDKSNKKEIKKGTVSIIR